MSSCRSARIYPRTLTRLSGLLCCELAQALRSGCPIFVSEEVLHAAKVLPNTAETQPTEQDVRKWLENLGDEDLGKYKM